jgi:membrane protein implicated in regulation of membrane protease activity
VGRQAAVAFYVLALVAVVVGVDVLFLQHRFWVRLIVNVGIVLVFAAFYFRFLKRVLARTADMSSAAPVAVRVKGDCANPGRANSAASSL